MAMRTLVYFLTWGALIFLMMRFGCGAHVMGHGQRHSPSSSGARWIPPTNRYRSGLRMTIDTAGDNGARHTEAKAASPIARFLFNPRKEQHHAN